jgi:hypothetical protein
METVKIAIMIFIGCIIAVSLVEIFITVVKKITK